MSKIESNVVSLPIADDSLIPDGVYEVAFERYQLASRFGRGSLELWFRVLNYGPHFGKEVPRYYKVELEGKQTFRASRHSAFAREFRQVFGKQAAGGANAVRWYRDIAVLATIRTVTNNYKQRTLSEGTRYNVIDDLKQRVRA